MTGFVKSVTEADMMKLIDYMDNKGSDADLQFIRNELVRIILISTKCEVCNPPIN